MYYVIKIVLQQSQKPDKIVILQHKVTQPVSRKTKL